MHTSRYRLPILAVLLAGPCIARSAEAPADLVVFNGQVLTVDAKSSRASAVAIKDGVFVAVGSDAEIRRRIGPQTRAIDAQGRTVVPGLIESHVHATGAARGEARQPFRQLNSIGEIQDWVRQQVKSAAPGAWILLPRVDVTRIRERRIPTRADLDAAAPANPAVFTWQYANKTVQVLNSRAMAAAGLNRDTRAPAGGTIEFDARGEPTGRMENAGGLIAKFTSAPPIPEEKYRDALAELLRRYNEIGITSIGERNSNVEGVRTYQKLKDEGRLTVRATVTIALRTDGSVAATEKAIQAIPFKSGEGDDWVRVGPLKIGVDGGALYGTAYMREPYGPGAATLYGITDPQYRGDLRVDVAQMTNIFRTGHRMGWQMCAHVTGDAGVDAVLDALEAAAADAPVSARRFNFLHAYFPHEDTARRVVKLGAIIDTQPAWFYKDGDALIAPFGKRMEDFIGVQTWRKAGAKVALNSDHMQGFDPNTSLNPYNPFLAIQAAVTRRTEGGKLVGLHQRISRDDALRMVTIDAAYVSFDEQRKGSIEVGKLGDLAILTGDYLKHPENRLHELRAQVTVVGGKVVYERGAAPTAQRQ